MTFLLSPAEWAVVGLSLKVSLLAIGLTLPLAFALAWLLARTRMPGRAVVDALVEHYDVLALGLPDGERAKINAWVEEQTRARIKDLLPAGSLRADARLVLVNAVYFKASWEDAAKNAVETASHSLRDLRIAEVTKLDMRLDDKGKVVAYRARVSLSFKYAP